MLHASCFTARAIAAGADDPDDDTFVECAVAGGADVIVSGDPHLLGLGAFEGIPVLRPAAFLALLKEAGGIGS